MMFEKNIFVTMTKVIEKMCITYQDFLDLPFCP